jgi:hypothetical protein
MIRIFIGYDPREAVAFNVLAHSDPDPRQRTRHDRAPDAQPVGRTDVARAA